MRTFLDCIPCFMQQTLSAGRLMGMAEEEIKHVMDVVGREIEHVSLSSTPPEMARILQARIHEITGKSDPYEDIKRESNKIALSYVESMSEAVNSSEERLRTALQVAIAGNIIDYGAIHDLDVAAELKKLLDQERMQLEIEDTVNFAYEAFKQDLGKAEKLLYIGDNAGEIVFDKILIETILEEYPHIDITFATRGAPILNDALLSDAYDIRLDKIVKVVSSGSDAPGCILSLCNDEFLEMFSSTDLIISKGQGNFESLSDASGPIYFLLIAKCAAVARELACAQRDIILKKKQ